MTRARWSWLALALTGALAAGCGSSSNQPERMTLAALSINAPSAAAPSPSPPDMPCRHVTASLRPPNVMPTPGAMPAGSFMAKIKRRGYLIAGVDQNTLRFAYFNPLTGRIEGFEIDLLRQLSEAIFGAPDRIKFKAITTDERVSAVQNGSVDVVADAMTITCQRRRQVDFSTVYYDAGQKVLVPSNSSARDVGDLGGKRVCVTRGSTSLETLEQQRPRPIAYPVEQRTDCLVALQEGRVAAVTSDDSILLGFEAQDPDTKIVGPRFANEPYGMAISKAHPDFVSFVNGVLAKVRADGTWTAIYRRWLGGLTPSIPAPPTASYEQAR
jgi:polar amino acid transport system substrate-binding protein